MPGTLLPLGALRGGRTRSRAGIIADVAFISLWRLHREKKHVVASNSCVFRTVSKLCAKYKLYTGRNFTAPCCARALS